MVLLNWRVRIVHDLVNVDYSIESILGDKFYNVQGILFGLSENFNGHEGSFSQGQMAKQLFAC